MDVHHKKEVMWEGGVGSDAGLATERQDVLQEVPGGQMQSHWFGGVWLVQHQ